MLLSLLLEVVVAGNLHLAGDGGHISMNGAMLSATCKMAQPTWKSTSPQSLIFSPGTNFKVTATLIHVATTCTDADGTTACALSEYDGEK